MVKKLDLGKVKEYLFFKGERFGLGLAMVIAVVFLAYGVLTASKSNPPANAATWQEAIAKATKAVEDHIRNAPEAPKAAAIQDKGPEWKVSQDFAAVAPWFPIDMAEITKRRNPEVVAIEYIKAEYVRAGILTYDIQPNAKDPAVGIIIAPGGAGARPGGFPAFKGGPGAGQGQGEDNLVRLMRAKRLIVVNAVFPMHEQYERFREALRLPTIAELLNNKELAPRFLGFDVVRREILPNNQRGVQEVLYRYDAKKGKTLVVSKKVDQLFREMVVDEGNVQKYLAHLYPTPLTPSLATPLPKLALGQYPAVGLPGIPDPPEGAEEVMKPGFQPPMVGGEIKLPGRKGPMEVMNPGNVAGGGEGKYALLPWNKLSNPALREKLKGNYNPVDPMGVFLEWADDKKGMVPGDGKMMFPGAMPMGPMGPMGVGIPPMGPVRPGDKDNTTPGVMPEKIPDALIRFIDVDVDVGKSYEYSLQLWLANPNYGKKSEVTHAALADVKELRSPTLVFAKLPAPVPEEHFYYVVDQQKLVSKVARGGPDYKPTEKEKDKAPVQIHTWVTSIRDRLAGNKERVIGDWVIAERILLRRGEFIGRNEFMVEVPEWEPMQNRFVLGSSTPFVKADKKKPAANINATQATGIPVDFIVAPLPRVPLLVDFDGGKRTNHKVGPTTWLNDESAFEVLILDGNGKLIVRNSRDDTELADRQGRHQTWGQRVNELRQNAHPGGFHMPGPGNQKDN